MLACERERQMGDNELHDNDGAQKCIMKQSPTVREMHLYLPDSCEDVE